MANIQNILDSIKEVNHKSCEPVFIPSLKRDVNFEPLTAKDQKLLLESNIDNIIYQSKYYLTIYDLIKRLAEEDIVNELTTYDRDVILLQLRALFLDHIYSVKGSDSLNLLGVIDNIKTKEFSVTSSSCSHGDIIVNCSDCKLKKEKGIYDYIQQQNVTINPQKPEELREIIGNVYIYEIYKYVDSILIDNGAEDYFIDFSATDFSIEEKVNILLSLDRKLLQKLMDFISSLKDNYTDSFKVGEVEIFIGSELFSI